MNQRRGLERHPRASAFLGGDPRVGELAELVIDHSQKLMSGPLVARLGGIENAGHLLR